MCIKKLPNFVVVLTDSPLQTDPTSFHLHQINTRGKLLRASENIPHPFCTSVTAKEQRGKHKIEFQQLLMVYQPTSTVVEEPIEASTHAVLKISGRGNLYLLSHSGLALIYLPQLTLRRVTMPLHTKTPPENSAYI